jgi:hypothetical protein
MVVKAARTRAHVADVDERRRHDDQREPADVVF